MSVLEIQSGQEIQVLQAVLDSMEIDAALTSPEFTIDVDTFSMSVESEIFDGEIDLYIDCSDRSTGHHFVGTITAESIEEAVSIVRGFMPR